MNNPPNPLPLPHTEALQGTLDERIAQAEQRLVARELGLRARWQGLGQRARRATQPRRLVLPLLGTVAALLAAVWWLRRGHATRDGALAAAGIWGAMRAPSAPVSARWNELPWVRRAALVWPLLPQRWRARISPGTASMMVAVGLPLAEQLFKPRFAPPLPCVDSADWARLAGEWTELATLAPSFGNACAAPRRYTFTPSGDLGDRSDRVDLRVRCGETAGTSDTDGAAPGDVHASVRVLPGSAGARFEYSLLPAWLRWLPWAWSERRILHLDADYSLALMGNPQRDGLWLLSRHARPDAQQMQALVQRARELGFPVERLQVGSTA